MLENVVRFITKENEEESQYLSNVGRQHRNAHNTHIYTMAYLQWHTYSFEEINNSKLN